MSDSLSVIAENFSEEGAKLQRIFARFPTYLDDLCRELLGQSTAEVGDEELELSYRQMKDDLKERLAQKANISQENGSDHSFLAMLEPVLAAKTAQAIVQRVKVISYLPVYENTPVRIAYFRNGYSDLAYRAFAKVLTEPTVSYHDSFSAVCEELYSDRCDLAILPTESSGDGKLTAIEKLIAKYDLAPMLYCRIPVKEDGYIRFGLFAPTPTVFRQADSLSFTLYSDSESSLSHLLTSAMLLDCHLAECKVLKNNDIPGGFLHAWQLTVSVNEPDALMPFWVLLRCEYPHHLLSGIFRELNEK